jgi:hypothetical protein
VTYSIVLGSHFSSGINYIDFDSGCGATSLYMKSGIVTSFETAFKIANGRQFNQNEISEINKVINARMPLIRSALFGTG